MFKRVIVLSLLMQAMAYSAVASWYSKGFEGKPTASGYRYNSNQMTCASNEHKLGSVLKVVNNSNGRHVYVVVTDRGSFDRKYGRHIDLSKKAFSKLDNINKGLIDVNIYLVRRDNLFKYEHDNPVFKDSDILEMINY